MFKKLSLAGAALAMGVTALIPAAPAAAQSYGRHYDQRGYDNRGYNQRGYDQRGYDQRGYDHRGYDQRYRGGYRGGYAVRGYNGYDSYNGYDGYNGYYRDDRCRSDGAGTIIGAIAGGLLGSSVAGRGDHALGAVIGAGAGALAGHAIERSDRSGYCR